MCGGRRRAAPARRDRGVRSSARCRRALPARPRSRPVRVTVRRSPGDGPRRARCLHLIVYVRLVSPPPLRQPIYGRLVKQANQHEQRNDHKESLFALDTPESLCFDRVLLFRGGGASNQPAIDSCRADDANHRPEGREQVLRGRARPGCLIALRAGEVRALAGENGAGKSTIVRMLAGVQRPDEGDVLVDGGGRGLPRSRRRARRGIAVIYQEPTLFPDPASPRT